MLNLSPYIKKQIKEANVTILDEEKLLMKCNVDGKKWEVERKQSGRIGHGWWKCPNGCSDKK